jgi:hypothetical protein
MTEKEQEILCRLLIELFLESPRRRKQSGQQDNKGEAREKDLPVTRRTRGQQSRNNTNATHA